MFNSFKKLMIASVAIEIIIFLLCLLTFDTTGDIFRYAARYSGRFSFLLFLCAFFLFTVKQPQSVSENTELGKFIKIFSVMHLIHFGFLATSVYVNSVPLETVKVIGGALAYLMIVLAPFKLGSVAFKFQLVYFYYVSLVMALTYVARIKGDFQGAEPHWVHFLGLGLMIIACVVFGVLMYFKRKS